MASAETDQGHQSTWGASETVKRAWDNKFGKALRKNAAEAASVTKPAK